MVIDLRGVPSADSAGIRALVRGHTSAQRLNRRFTLVSPNPRVQQLLELSLLTRVLEVVDSLVEAKTKSVHWDRIWTGIAVTFVGLALVGVGVTYPDLGLGGTTTTGNPFTNRDQAAASGAVFAHPLFELAKLDRRRGRRHARHRRPAAVRAARRANPALEQAQVLLCVSGALMMIIIGSSLARAFGIAGAASIIRFRTPVEDAARHHRALHPDGRWAWPPASAALRWPASARCFCVRCFRS